MTDTNLNTDKQDSAFTRIIRASEIDTRMLGMIVVLVVIWVGLNIATGGIFLSARNLYNLAVQTSVVGIMATGMVLVIVARHIDLSVGSVMGVIGMVIAWLQVDIFPLNAGWNWPLTIVCGATLGVLIGIFQGWFTAYRGIPAFVVTLGGMLAFRGGAFLVTDGRTVAPMNKTYQLLGGGIDGSIGTTWSLILGIMAVLIVAFSMYRGHASRVKHGFPTKPIWLQIVMFAVIAAVIFGFVYIMNSYNKPRSDIGRGIPVPVLILIAVVIVMTLLSRITKFGRYVYAIGANPEAAELSGIDVKKVTTYIFVIMGVLCAIAAVITTARLNAGTNSMGVSSELLVIAAAIIGGTSLAGGEGSIPGAILGAIIMQSIENAMVLLGAGSGERMVVMGLVLIIAVWFDTAYQNSKK
ncbi:MAG: sugar ABC transporter permease [Hyphomicrobiales bacterium]|nr:MAG: sugar ABC transporter permease [Hyphomicrobiales bacterium]